MLLWSVEIVKLVLNSKELEARPKAQIAVSQSKAKEFLSVFHRFKRNVWDRSRPDVQQWIQQFMYMGYDEAVGKTVITQIASITECEIVITHPKRPVCFEHFTM
uniref:ECRG4 augurin precursor b n=1 Tax=Sinocyclocheilus rhinocerous TaxID=307959 RepID=A0A673FN82_9TELE